MEDMIEQKKEKPSEKNIYFRRLNNLSQEEFTNLCRHSLK